MSPWLKRAQQEKDKSPIQFDLSAEQLERIEKLRTTYRLRDRNTVLTSSLSLLETAALEAAQGATIGARTDKGIMTPFNYPFLTRLNGEEGKIPKNYDFWQSPKNLSPGDAEITMTPPETFRGKFNALKQLIQAKDDGEVVLAALALAEKTAVFAKNKQDIVAKNKEGNIRSIALPFLSFLSGKHTDIFLQANNEWGGVEGEGRG